MTKRKQLPFDLGNRFIQESSDHQKTGSLKDYDANRGFFMSLNKPFMTAN